jgi:hypothetical protein
MSALRFSRIIYSVTYSTEVVLWDRQGSISLPAPLGSNRREDQYIYCLKSCKITRAHGTSTLQLILFASARDSRAFCIGPFLRPNCASMSLTSCTLYGRFCSVMKLSTFSSACKPVFESVSMPARSRLPGRHRSMRPGGTKTHHSSDRGTSH